MTSLILAGESIYMLPYMRKTFQTSMRDVLHLDNTQVGFLNSMFGLLALICYFPGGWLADRFSARKLLVVSLLATGLGGLYLATVPSYAELLALHAFWGVASILTFWAALIKATREWGAANEQGKAFGILDGGRGLVGALLASGAVWIFSLYASNSAGFKAVVVFYSLAPLLAALAVWFFVPDEGTGRVAAAPRDDDPVRKPAEAVLDKSRLREVLRRPVVWLHALVILCAYMAYVGSFDFAAYAQDGFGQSAVFGAQLGTFRDWFRPIACVGAGLLADRVSPTKAVTGAFAWLTLSFVLLAWTPARPDLLPLLWVEVGAAAVAVFALRGIYYALLEEGRIPKTLTGTAVGVVSVIGFMPDIFAHPLAGWFIDSYPGAKGYQRYFFLLAIVSAVGVGATLAIRRVTQKHVLQNTS